MTDPDREAFEAWARSSGAAANDRGCDNFFSETMRIAFQAWQAARDHYAPKLTEKEVRETITTAFPASANFFYVEICGHRVISALRAAGVRFREEA
jgi:hypothetical protein